MKFDKKNIMKCWPHIYVQFDTKRMYSRKDLHFDVCNTVSTSFRLMWLQKLQIFRFKPYMYRQRSTFKINNTCFTYSLYYSGLKKNISM